MPRAGSAANECTGHQHARTHQKVLSNDSENARIASSNVQLLKSRAFGDRERMDQRAGEGA